MKRNRAMDGVEGGKGTGRCHVSVVLMYEILKKISLKESPSSSVSHFPYRKGRTRPNFGLSPLAAMVYQSSFHPGNPEYW